MSLLPQQEPGSDAPSSDFPGTTEKIRTSTNALGISATSFAKVISKAFADATTGGKQFDDVLKQLALRLSSMAVTRAFQPIAKGLVSGLGKLIGDLFGDDSETGGKSRSRRSSNTDILSAIEGLTPFAAGGVIGTPTYFPLSGGGTGLAGEAGPEAILPLTRGSDGRLGVATSGPSGTANVTVQIAAPDVESFRRSEAYITGQIARAVARGQRGF